MSPSVLGFHVISLMLFQCLNMFCAAAEPSDPGAKPKTDALNALVAEKEKELASGVVWGYQVFFLLHDSSVRRELKLTVEQKACIVRLSDEFLDAATAKPQPAAKSDSKSEEISAAEWHRRRKRTLELLKSAGEKASALLSHEQKQRLLQVVFQLRNVEMFYQPEVASVLGLSGSQKAEMVRIQTWFRDEATKVHTQFMGKKPDRKAFDERTDLLMEEAKQRALKVMSEEQRNLIAALEGAKIGFARHDVVMEVRKSRPAGKDMKNGAPAKSKAGP